MALMYPWATKEYLLWEMTIGQIIMYFNLGMKKLHPEDPNKSERLADKSYEDLKEIRDKMIEEGLISKEENNTRD